MGTNKTPRICVILPTWNRAGYLRKALKGLTAQTLEQEEFEVIVIDDGSTDTTHQIVDLFKENLQLNYLQQEHAGNSVAKNRGIESARAPIILFVDDDDVASPTLLEEHIRSHERYPDPFVAVLGRTELPSWVASKPLMHLVTEVSFHLFAYPKVPADEFLDYTWFWAGRSSCKTALLRNYGNFNPMLPSISEDIELGYRLSEFGFRVVYNPRAVNTMLRALSFEDFCKRAERDGESRWIYTQIHPTDEARAWSGTEGALKRWAEIEDSFETTLTRARHLDRLANLRVEEGLELDSFLLAELQRAYVQSFEGCRLRGIRRAMRR